MATVHTLKTVSTVWDAVACGAKRFEVRRNDRFFQQGDTVRLRKIDSEGKPVRKVSPNSRFGTTTDIDFRIGWMLHGGQFGIEPGYVVFQLEPLPEFPLPTPGDS